MPRERIERTAAYILCAIFVLGYAVTMIREAHQPLLTDEVFVVWTLRTFAPGQIVSALQHGVDSLPPAYYYFQCAIVYLIGLTPLTLRLSSIVAYFVFMACIFQMLRRRVPVGVAALAATVPLLTASSVAATTGRLYVIVAACFAASVLIWLGGDDRRRPLSMTRTVLLALTLACAVCVHFYATMLCVTFGLMEALRSWRYKTWHWRHWIAIAAGGSAVLLSWPVVGGIYRFTHASTGAPMFYARPTLDALAQMSTEILVGGDARYLLIALVGLLVVAAVLSASARRSPAGADPFRDADLDIVTLGGLALPVISFIFAVFVTRSLVDRHVYTAVVSASLALAWAIRRLPWANAICLLLMLFVIERRASPFGGLGGTPEPDDRASMIARTADPWPVVIPDGGDFFELNAMMPSPQRDRLVFMRMPVGATSPDPEPELIASVWKGYRPELAVVTAEEFLPHTPRFYVLYSGSWREGVTDWLIQHARVRVVEHVGGLWMYEVEPAR